MPEIDEVEDYVEQVVTGDVERPSPEEIWVYPDFLSDESEKAGYAMALQQVLLDKYGDVGTEVLPEGPIVVTVE